MALFKPISNSNKLHPALSQSEEISSNFCCCYGGGISYNEDIMHLSKVCCWKLVVRALTVSCSG